MVKRSTSCCDGSGSSGEPNPKKKSRVDKFGLTNPIAGCVPPAAMQNLPEFLKWFSKDATPIICAAQAIKGKKCMVLAGAPNDGYRGIELSQLMAECNIATGEIDCVKFMERMAFNGPKTCIPSKITEDADIVMSVNQVTGEVAWRRAPNLSCELLSDFLKPTPVSAVGCFRKSAVGETIANVFSITTTGELVWGPPGTTTGPAPAVTCAAVVAALEEECMPEGTITTHLGFKVGGGLVTQRRKRLIRAIYYGPDITPESFTDRVGNHGDPVNRRVWKWEDRDSNNPTLAPGQFPGDLTYDDATRRFVIGHTGHYRFNTGIMVSAIHDTSSDPNVSLSFLAGFRLDRTTGATELRFGEVTIDMDSSPALLNGLDYYFTGSWSGYLPAGSTIAVRYWAAPGNFEAGEQILTLQSQFDRPTSYFCIEELDDFAP